MHLGKKERLNLWRIQRWFETYANRMLEHFRQMSDSEPKPL